MKYKPLLPPPPISPIATASEEQENNNDNQNEIHSFPPIHTSATWARMIAKPCQKLFAARPMPDLEVSRSLSELQEI